MNETSRHANESEADRLARLEARLAHLEEHLGLAGGLPARSVTRHEPVTEASAAAPAGQGEDEFEFEVGQNWFARVGIFVLAIGVGFALSLPYHSLPAGVPSLGGYLLAGILFVVSHAWRRSFEMMSGYLRGAAMVLLYFATLRLYFFGAQQVLDTASLTGRAVLLLAVGINFAIAYRRKSPWLMGLAVIMGCLTLLAVGAAGFVLPGLVVLAGFTVLMAWKCDWPGLLMPGIGFGYATYLLWAINNPVLTRTVRMVTEPWAAPGVVLAMAVLFAGCVMLRRDRAREDWTVTGVALLNCGLGYGLFFLHTLLASGPLFARLHVAASAVFLGLAVAFWLREHSRGSTFFYAMTGYAALSMAIIKESPMPAVFVWLSLQSIVVVATAVWFRSRFIIVANFLIYVAIVLGYVVVAQRETGISIGFGIVALTSARLLNWQKNRLELKTELMRNAYLLGAFLAFPYALYHLVPGRHVGLAWVGLAVMYYLLNLLAQNRKYRWMGHATLLLTTCYLVIVGTRRFEPAYRIVSFLVLGTLLLIVSLSFTRWRARQQAKSGE